MPAKRPGKPRGNQKPPIGRRFVKGQSGNPGGRPKYAEISKAVRFILEQENLSDFKPKTVAEQIALIQIQESIKKNRGATDFVANRAEGMPTATVKSSVDLTGTNVIVDLLKPPDKAE